MPPNNDPESDLRNAARHLYATFETYRGTPHWSDALDNKSPDDDLSVVRAPVHALAQEHFDYYGSHAISLCDGGTPALKYFFPRVLVEAAEGSSRDLPLEMYTDYMNRHDWRQWPEVEKDAIAVFFAAWFAASLNSLRPPFIPPAHEPERHAERILADAAFLGLALDPLLAAWERDESIAATSQIVACLNKNVHFIASHATLDHWQKRWGNAGANLESPRQVVRFLTSPRTHSRLERAFCAATLPKAQQALGEACDHLQNIYTIWHGSLSELTQLPNWAKEVAREIKRPK